MKIKKMMNFKNIIGIFLVSFSISAYAIIPDIVAIVDDSPITKFDFFARKKMAINLNNINVSDPSIDAKLNQEILNILIEEELLIQHVRRTGSGVSDEEIENAIRNIEENNNMPKGGMETYLKERSVSISSFKRQLTGEIIKQGVVNSLSHSISVSQAEVNSALFNSGQRNFDVETWIFTAKDDSVKTIDKMKLFRKKATNCDNINEKLYMDFANGEKFEKRLNEFSTKTQTVINDTKINSTSNVYKENDDFKMALVCKKESILPKNEKNKIASILSQKKMSQKAMKFFKDLKARAYIKKMLPS